MAPSAVLLDIEGTVCPISFVKDTLFPYALDALPSYLRDNWTSESFQPYRAAFPDDVRDSPERLESYVRELTAKDLKVPCFKQLQGLLWRVGYETGAIKAPIYDDVLEVIRKWTTSDRRVVIYSSGSVAAQKLLFAHTTAEPADITPLLSGYYDTVNAGMKQEAASYAKIAAAENIPPTQWLFLSDNVNEVAAAKAAGMDAVVVVRPGNAPLTDEDRKKHAVIESFAELSA